METVTLERKWGRRHPRASPRGGPIRGGRAAKARWRGARSSPRRRAAWRVVASKHRRPTHTRTRTREAILGDPCASPPVSGRASHTHTTRQEVGTVAWFTMLAQTRCSSIPIGGRNAIAQRDVLPELPHRRRTRDSQSRISTRRPTAAPVLHRARRPVHALGSLSTQVQLPCLPHRRRDPTRLTTCAGRDRAPADIAGLSHGHNSFSACTTNFSLS